MCCIKALWEIRDKALESDGRGCYTNKGPVQAATGASDGALLQMNERTGVFAGDDPFAIARRWLAEAERSEPNDPNAIALSTVDESGLPNVRMVLLKDIEEASFVFYTNFGSAKGRELLWARKAAFVMHWKSLRGRRNNQSLCRHAGR